MIFFNPVWSIFWSYLFVASILYVGRAMGFYLPLAWLEASLVATLITVSTLLVVRRNLVLVVSPNAMSWKLVVMALIFVAILARLMHYDANPDIIFLTAIYLGMCLRALVHVWRLIVLADKPLEPGVPYEKEAAT